jgi:environmental stress-induced protein Ves
MTATVLRWEQYAVMPWRNAGGSTREVARRPPEADSFDWRISIADISSSGPFSTFPGVDRVIMVCEQGQLSLSVDGVDRPLLPDQPYRFAGEASTSCRAEAAPVRALNVMTRRGSYSSRVTSLAAGRYLGTAPDGTELTVLIALQSETELITPVDGTFGLSAYDAVLLQPAARSGSRVTGRAAVIDVVADRADGGRDSGRQGL